MSLRSMVLAAFALLPLSALQAQEESDAVMAVTVFGGLTGGAELWTVAKQPVSLINSDLTTVGRDTFALRRSAGSGLVVGMAAVLFQSNHLGLGAEVSYTGPSEQNECSIVFRGTPSPGSEEARGFNDDLCLAIDRDDGVLGSVSLLAEAWLSAGSPHGVAPFLRFGAGVADLGRSSAEMSGRFLGPDANGNRVADVVNRPVILDQRTGTAGFTFGAGLGLLMPLAGGYSLRLEARDQVFLRAVATGPADALSVGQVAREWFHHPSLIVGFGVRMERRRGRVRRGQ